MSNGIDRKNLVATWASGEEFCKSNGFLNYIKSLDCITNAEKVIFTHDMPVVTREFLGKFGIQIVDVDPKKVHYLIRDRHLAYWEFLVENSHRYHHCIFADSKDVIFQEDPFGYVLFGPMIAFVSEGMTHSQSGWNSIDQYECQRNVREFSENLSPRPVLNGGVILGSSEELKNFFLLLWTNTVRCVGSCTDQAVLNYLFTFLEKEGKQRYVVCDPYRDRMCLTGEAVKEKFFRPTFKDGVFFHPETEKPYYIVHQYERINKYQVDNQFPAIEIADVIYEKYGQILAQSTN